MDKVLPYRVMKVLESCSSDVAQTCKYTKNHWNVYFKMVTFVGFEVYLNKQLEKSVCLWNRYGGVKWVLVVLTLRPHSLHKKVDGSPGVQRTWSWPQWALTTKGELPQAEKGETCHQLYVSKPVRHNGVALCNELGRQVFDKCPLWGPISSWTPGGCVVRS